MNLFLVFILSLFLFVSPQTINLSRLKWSFTNSNRSIQGEARIPGDIYSDLLAHGLIPDPYFGNNDQKLRWVAREKWTYKTKVNIVPEDVKVRKQ